MNKFLIGAVGVLAIGLGAAPAAAADLAPRHYTKAPPMVAAVYDWTGFYIGVNGGGGWGRDRISPNLAGAASFSADTSGALVGGQIGYNWQTGPWVLGLEADGDWADINGSTSCPVAGFICASHTRTLASFRGRIGYAASNMLFYGTGGAGYANVRETALTAAGAPGPGVPAPTGVFNSDRWGYAAGAGIEWGFAPNWSAKVEYMHYGFGTDKVPVGTLDAVVSAGSRLDVDTVKVGVNFRWGGPAVARY